jgi:hypothetical protein
MANIKISELPVASTISDVDVVVINQSGVTKQAARSLVKGTASGTAGGDLAGTYPNPTLATITTAQTGIGSSTAIPVLSIDAKGRVTALTTAAVQAASTTAITALTGDVTATGPGSVSATLQSITTAQSNVGSSTQIPVLSIDAKGRVTALTTASINALTTNQIAGLSTTTPAALATTGVVGLSTFAARADHQHIYPTLTQLGAQAALTTSAPLDLSLGGTGVITSSGANSVVLRDANQNITANAYINNLATITASGTPIVLTVASAPVSLVSGSGGQVIQLPNATTLQNGTIFSFNNNQSSGAITVNNSSSTLIVSVPSGGYTTVVLLSNSTAAGTWDRHDQSPSNVSWSTNTFDYAGSITSATWNGNAVAINRGGTGAISQQAAINALTGTQTAGQYLRSDGTNSALSAIQAADVPTLNQNTTGTAANVTGTVAVANGGTGATTAQTAISNLGVGMRMIEAQTTASITGTMNTGVSPNTFIITATGVFTTDGYTPVLGDIIAFTLQGGGTSTQNGFWQLTTAGDVGVQAVFTRPAWYTGTVKNTMYATRFGTTQGGYFMVAVGPSGNSDIVIGTNTVQVLRVSYRFPAATTATNTYSGRQTFLSNSATNAPFQFQAGTALVTTPVAHYVEWFNDQMYLTTAAGVRTTNTNHVAIPATATSTGQVGQIAVDNAGSWLYVCTATNVWKRVLLTTF